ncbi:MAG: hypothetical protein A3E07_01930 [Candidatus Wildermuthbacteria bacterium RIFCSPHIGHO2_12_FULL_45_9]|nr:MAG: hypothetical protein A3E07_01930 [Candidatus Wildermuthbacteria bacterium RIFCSPHIGHO2_12_FULL_45_9]
MTKKEKYDPEGIIPDQKSQHDVIARLLREEHGINRYEEIDGDAEGDILPGDIPNESSAILTADGRVFYLWLDWDPEKEPPAEMKALGVKGWYTLGEDFKDPHTGEPYPLFREVFPGNEAYPNPDDQAFIRARKELDLPLTQEQERILKEGNS